MKKIILGFLCFGFFGSASSYAADIVCSKKTLLNSYRLSVEMEDKLVEEATKENFFNIFITRSNNAATRRGEQSEAQIGMQVFKWVEPDEESESESEAIVLDQPVGKLYFDKISMAPGGPEDFIISVYGKSLPHGKLVFKNCLSVD